jgi:competence protein ComEC
VSHPDLPLIGVGLGLAATARLHPVSSPVVPAALLAIGVVALVVRKIEHPHAVWLLLGLAFALSSESVLADRSLAGLHVESTVVEGTATLLRDPVRDLGGVRVDVRLHGRRLLARARGPAGAVMGRLLAGQRVHVTGRQRSAAQQDWRIARHLAGDLVVTGVGSTGDGNPLAVLSNGIRIRLLRSARTLPSIDRGLFGGFVLGDAREQRPLVTDDFRGAGLTHLLVVSGQNVAFVLAAFRPIILRLRRRGRLGAVLFVIVVFAAVTRFEPSVLRASWMAGVAATANMLGRRQSALRVLGLASCALLLIDPLLAWSVGFALSVVACLGLALITPRLETVFGEWGCPSWLAVPAATALGAELGVSLVMVPVFGGVPLISLPANLLALPAAEPVMAWGVAAGLPAGLVEPLIGGGPSRLVHIPTRFALDWVRTVAAVAARVPLGDVNGRQFVLLATVVALAFAVRRVGGGRAARHPDSGAGDRWHRRTGRFAVVACIAILGVPLARNQTGSGPVGSFTTTVGWQGRLQRHVDVLVLRHGARAGDVLQSLRRSRVAAIDLVVVESGGRAQSDLVTALSGRVEIGAVLAADRAFVGHVRPMHVAEPGLVLRAGHTRVVVDDVRSNRLTLRLVGPSP